MNWELQDSDRELFERELYSFLPARIFDAHAHFFRKSDYDGKKQDSLTDERDFSDLSFYLEKIADIHPGRQSGGLFFGYPDEKCDPEVDNQVVAIEVRRAANCLGQMLIRPEMDPEYIRETVRRENLVGLKCYHVYATEQPTMEARIPSYLPEEHVRIAHEEGLSITLHIVRARALSDPANQETIRHYAEKYPNSRLILAHAARGFNPYHTIEGIPSLRGLSNVWFDTAAVTEVGAFEAIIQTMGVDRLLYGSDFPISHLRGRCVAIGDSFHWLSPENTDFSAGHIAVQPSLVGIESLRVLKRACLNLRLSDSEVESIFYGNAAQLFGLPR